MNDACWRKPARPRLNDGRNEEGNREWDAIFHRTEQTIRGATITWKLVPVNARDMLCPECGRKGRPTGA